MWAAAAIDDWTGPSTLQVDSESGVLKISTEALLRVEILKNLTWYFVIDRPALGSAQRGQERLIRELFTWLVSWVEASYTGAPTGNSERDNYAEGGLPARLVDYLDIAFRQKPADGGYREERKSTARAVVDYIVSLTEGQTVDLHARLGGTSVESMLDGWFAV
jgi:dGTPase